MTWRVSQGIFKLGGELMKESFMRRAKVLGVGTLFAVGLTTSASALNYKIGDVDLRVDINTSAGVSVRVADRNDKLLPSVNGGPTSSRAFFIMGENVTAATVATGAVTYQVPISDCNDNGALKCARNAPTTSDGAYASSINGDDSRLNWDRGDLTSASLKTTIDIDARAGNWSYFMRINGFNDFALDSSGGPERTAIGSDAESDSIRNIELLDAFISYDGQVGSSPYQLKVGRQVLNWGESTFVLGGNSVFNPIDVNAFVRPGSEIKEALLPVEAISGSISLTDNLSVEAYVGGWDKIKLPSAGTPFGFTDGFVPGGVNGSFIGGNYASGTGRINCHRTANAPGATAAGVSTDSSAGTQALGQAYEAALLDAYGFNCSIGDQDARRFLDYRYALGTGGSSTAEQERIAGQDPYFLPRAYGRDEEGEFDGNNHGIALKYYAENLNSTEFGLYYQRYQSRIPYVSIFTKGPSTGMASPGAVTDTHLALGNHGAAYGQDLSAVFAASPSALTPAPSFSGNVMFGGLQGFGSTCAAGWQPTAMAPTHPLFPLIGVTGASVAGYNAISVTDDIGMLNGSAGQLGAAIDSLVTGTPVATPGVAAGTQIVAGSLAHLISVNCAIMAHHVANNAGTNEFGVNAGEIVGGIGWGGSEFVAEYPTIDSYGASFATTLFDWGVQGEFVFRPDMPLQIDTDSVVISTLVANCGFMGYGGGSTTIGFTGNAYYNSAKGLNCGDTGLISGIDHQDVWNWDVGTTATFPASNPVTSAIGADRIVLLTEFAGVYADGIDDDTGKFESGMPTTNMCTSGSDLPLKSLFSLDPRDADECRATQHAYGMVLYLAAEYPNFLGSAWNYSTNVVYSAGLDGRAARPAGTWNEDIERASLGMNWEYQGHTKLSLSYSDYFGDEKYDASEDKDFVSFSYSRSF
jgi:hypothetical protein